MIAVLYSDPLIAVAEWNPGYVFPYDVPGVIFFRPAYDYDPKSAIEWYHSVWVRDHVRLRAILFSSGTVKYQQLIGKIPVLNITRSAFIDETTFRPLSSPKEYDAVYNARVFAEKNHHLAAGIARWAWIADGYGWDQPGWEELVTVIRALPGIVPLNPVRDGVIQSQGRDWVNTQLNRCKVGLALSCREGQMLASTEYLLAGLPVVTVVATGGREEYYDSRFVTIVEPDAGAVARAVWGWERRLPDPRVVRRTTVRKQRVLRRLFIRVLQAECERLGLGVDFGLHIWQSVYTDCFFSPVKYTDFIPVAVSTQ